MRNHQTEQNEMPFSMASERLKPTGENGSGISDLNKEPKKNERAEKSEGISVDFKELFYYFLPRLYIILIGTIIGAIVMGIYALAFNTPYYTATSKIYIVGQTDSSFITDLQIGSWLTGDFQEVFKTWEVNQMVNEQLGTNYSHSSLQSMLSIRNPEDTRVIYISVTNSSAQRAADIANAYAVAAQQFIAKSMEIPEPNIFSRAVVPTIASSINVTGFIIRGIYMGFFITAFILLLAFLLDNRPKSQDDIMRYANIPTLAVIPVDPALYNDNAHLGRQKRYE